MASAGICNVGQLLQYTGRRGNLSPQNHLVWLAFGPSLNYSNDGFLEGAENLLPELLSEYFPIAVFFAIAMGLAIAMVSASLLLGNQRPDDEKMAAYECGFDAFDDSRRQFDVRFYLVAILFIIFDLEVAFLFPWAVSLGGIGVFGFWSMMLFLAILTVGFIYEWKKGALEWE